MERDNILTTEKMVKRFPCQNINLLRAVYLLLHVWVIQARDFSGFNRNSYDLLKMPQIVPFFIFFPGEHTPVPP